MNDWLLLKCPDCGNLFRVPVMDGHARATCGVCQCEMVYDKGEGDVAELIGCEVAPVVANNVSSESVSDSPEVTDGGVAVVTSVGSSVEERPLDDFRQSKVLKPERMPVSATPSVPRRSRNVSSEEDWDGFESNKSSQRSSVLVLSLLVLAIAGGLVAIVVSSGNSDDTRDESAPTLAEVGQGTEIDGVMPEELMMTDDQPIAEMDMVEERPSSDDWKRQVTSDPDRFIDDAGEVVKGFLASASVDDRLNFVADRERVEPVMREYYQRPGNSVEPIKYKKLFDGSAINVADHGVSADMLLADFSSRRMAIVREGDDWKIDWEAFVEYSAMTYSEFKSGRPADPRVFRVDLSVMTPPYHNFAFADPTRWVSLMAVFPDSADLLYAYVDRESEAATVLRPLLSGNDDKYQVTLMMKFPENSSADNQVEIVEVVCVGWSDLVTGE